MKTYNNTIKRNVQSILFSNFSIRSNALILGGPNFEEYVNFISNKVAKTKQSKIISYEMDNKTLNLQINDFRKLSDELCKRVSINFGDIKKSKPERFIDLDLMGSLITQKHIINCLFTKQRLLKTNLNRVFIFTISLRRSNLDEILSFVKQMLPMRTLNLIEKKKTLNKGIEYVLDYKSNKYNIQMYSYRDGCPMLTCCINY